MFKLTAKRRVRQGSPSSPECEATALIDWAYAPTTNSWGSTVRARAARRRCSAQPSLAQLWHGMACTTALLEGDRLSSKPGKPRSFGLHRRPYCYISVLNSLATAIVSAASSFSSCRFDPSAAGVVRKTSSNSRAALRRACVEALRASSIRATIAASVGIWKALFGLSHELRWTRFVARN